MMITPTIDPTIAVARPATGQLPAGLHRAAVRPHAGTSVSVSSIGITRWYAENGSTMPVMCAPGFAHLGNVGTDGSKRPDPGHLVGGLT